MLIKALAQKIEKEKQKLNLMYDTASPLELLKQSQKVDMLLNRIERKKTCLNHTA